MGLLMDISSSSGHNNNSLDKTSNHNRRSTTTTKCRRSYLASFMSTRSLVSEASSALESEQGNAVTLLDNDDLKTDPSLMDQLNSTISKLEQSKVRAQEQMKADTKLALQRYKAGKKQDAIEYMRSVHKNKQYKEYVTTATFELRGMKIELNNSTSSNGLLSSFSNQKIQMERILENKNAVGTVVPSDDMLARKLARLVRARSA